MKFPKKTLRLISVRTGTSKSGNPYSFVKLADESTFENADFMLGRDTRSQDLVIQERYDVVLDVDGKYMSVDLFSLPKK